MFNRALRARVRVALVLTIAGALVASPTVARAADTRVATKSSPQAAAGWLATQLVNDDHMTTACCGGLVFDDAGLTADAIIGFAAARVAGNAGARATAWLQQPANLSGYIGDGVGTTWAGATAKTALVAAVRGVNLHSFGGVDLIARLNARLQPSGRFADQSDFGDFSNAIGQSLAVIALTRAGGAPASAVNFLAAQRCADGGSSLDLEPPTCVSSVDATGFAAQALLAAGRTADANTELDYLVAQQASDGGFGSPANANSTGVAAQALKAGGRSAAANKAVAFLKTLQVGCKSGDTANRGAIKYSAGAFDPSTVARATAQAIGGLAGVGLATATSNTANANGAYLDCTQPQPKPGLLQGLLNTVLDLLGL